MEKIKINPKEDLVFDQKVREMCKWCKRFGKKATCPPYIESVDFYRSLLRRYNSGFILYDCFPTAHEQPKQLGRESSVLLHGAIARERRELFRAGHYLINSFGAGSCKLCESCTFPCPHPDRALIPVEATGINVVELMRKFNISIKFPVDLYSYVYRIGVIFYD